MKKATLLIALALAAGQTQAQSSLGIQGAELELGVLGDDAVASFGLDVAVTGAHGLQGDLAFTDTPNGMVGMVGAHVYMTPVDTQKYGVFGVFSDVDGRAMNWTSVGVEGMVSVGDDTLVEGRAGMGAGSGGLDYIFADASLVHTLTPTFELEASIGISEFDEAAFRAIGTELTLTARYQPEASPWSVYASIGTSDLHGRDGGPSETRLGLGLSMRFGRAGGTDPHERLFRTVDPVLPLIRRGAW